MIARQKGEAMNGSKLRWIGAGIALVAVLALAVGAGAIAMRGGDAADDSTAGVGVNEGAPVDSAGLSQMCASDHPDCVDTVGGDGDGFGDCAADGPDCMQPDCAVSSDGTTACEPPANQPCAADGEDGCAIPPGCEDGESAAPCVSTAEVLPCDMDGAAGECAVPANDGAGSSGNEGTREGGAPGNESRPGAAPEQ